jgi:hypothetical protein
MTDQLSAIHTWCDGSEGLLRHGHLGPEALLSMVLPAKRRWCFFFDSLLLLPRDANTVMPQDAC